jgi:hypothetical protein
VHRKVQTDRQTDSLLLVCLTLMLQNSAARLSTVAFTALSDVTSRYVTSRHVTSPHLTSRHVTSRHVTERHVTKLPDYV